MDFRQAEDLPIGKIKRRGKRTHFADGLGLGALHPATVRLGSRHLEHRYTAASRQRKIILYSGALLG